MLTLETPKNIFCFNNTGYVGTATNLQIVLNTPKNANLNQATQKYLPNFPTQKNPGIENFKPTKILRSSPSLEIRSTPWDQVTFTPCLRASLLYTLLSDSHSKTHIRPLVPYSTNPSRKYPSSN